MSKFKKSDFRPAGEWIKSLSAASKAKVEADAARIIEAARNECELRSRQTYQRLPSCGRRSGKPVPL